MVIMIKVWQWMVGNWAWRGEGRGGVGAAALLIHQWRGERKREKQQQKQPCRREVICQREVIDIALVRVREHCSDTDKRGRERRGPGLGAGIAQWLEHRTRD